MEEHVELPVNKEGFIRSNTKQAGLFSIMTSNEYAGELNAIVSKLLIVSNQSSFDYLSEAECFVRHYKNVRLDFDNRHKELRFSSHPYTENKYAYLYKEIEKDTSSYSIEVKVDYMQDSDAWSHIKIAFSNGITGYDKELRDAYFENECSLKLTSQGRLFFRLGSIQRDIRIFEAGMSRPVFLKLEFKSQVTAKYSFDGVHWKILCEEKIDYLEIEEAGLYIGPKINTFFYDFYISNIQLYFDSKKKRIITSPQLDHDDRYFSNVLEGYSLPRELISYSDIELIEFFMKLIVDHNYIYLQLHEFYIPESEEFHKTGLEYMNIIYGFDKKKRVFKRMSFYQVLEFSEISFDNFLTAYHYKNNRMDVITLYKYKSWRYPNSFDVDMVISNLKAYIRGKSSFAVTSRKTILYLTEKPFVYGVKIYQEIADHDIYMDSFLMNRQLSNQIYEHYLILLKMLEFMNHIKVISDEDYKIHAIGFKELARISSLVKNMIIRNELNQIEDIKRKIIELLRELKQKDETETEKLIRNLV